MRYTDSLHRTIDLPHTPQRIISLVPSLTELLHDMGLERQIVGITKYCVHPIHYIVTKSVVGGTKKVDFQIIKDLHSDFILCSKEENTEKMVLELEKTAPVYVSDVNSMDAALDLIKKLGLMLNRRTQAEHIVDKIIFRFKAFQNVIKDVPIIKVAYFIWAKPWMVAGNKTFINDMLKICRFENVYAFQDRYPEISIEKLPLREKRDVLFFSSEPYDFSDDEVYEVLQKNRKILTVYVDGQYFSWYGSRLIKAFEHFTQIHEKIANF